MLHPHLISSRHNPQFKRWLSLLETEGIKRHQQCLVSGKRLGDELLGHAGLKVDEILIPPSTSRMEIQHVSAPVFRLAGELFKAVDVFGTKGPLLICAVPHLANYDLTLPPNGLELLCPLGDPGNVGALLRGSLAFGVNRFILLRESAHPFHPKVIRGCSGAAFFLTMSWGCSVKELGKPEHAKWITALDLEGSDLPRFQWPRNIRLLIGEEGTGVPPIPFAQRVTIPQVHTAIPLNASTAGHIALYAYRQAHPLQQSSTPNKGPVE
jgi:RNA methyltransferase, TrmH family